MSNDIMMATILPEEVFYKSEIQFRRTMKIFVFSFCIALLISLNQLNAQSRELYAIKNDFTITIEGNSNLHDWNETVTKVTGKSVIVRNKDSSINIDSLCTIMDVKSIHSPDGETMVNKTMEALQADKFPFIIFALSMPLKMLKPYIDTIVSTWGNLTIAGVERHVKITGKIYRGRQGKFIFEGVQPILLSDYNIAPPTAMLGLLKVKDNIVIHYRTCFEIKN